MALVFLEDRAPVGLFSNQSVRHVHCIGIGGIGVSALAEILLKRNFHVSGSDSQESSQLDRLRALGADIYIGHQASHVLGANLVVYSSAVTADNPEYAQAVQSSIPLMQRGQLLADIMQLYQGVAVTGTHGKTTTTAILAHLCNQAGLDPTYFIGGIPNGGDSPVHLGQGRVFVAEADESDASFLYMQANLAVVTNIECDHMATYADSETALRESFLKFLGNRASEGAAVLCSDDQNIQKISPAISGKKLFYGVASSADYRIHNYVQKGLSSSAKLELPGGENITVHLNLPGLYNIKNAVAAGIAANQLGIDWVAIEQGWRSFAGVGRRFQQLGAVSVSNKHVSVFEDYGHHPTEIKVAYEAARSAFPSQRVVLIFQPHRYTRTRDLMAEFISALNAVDALVLLPTYAASEALLEGATSEALFKQLMIVQHDCFSYLPNVNQLHEFLASYINDGDVLLFQGAGDVTKMAKRFVEQSNGQYET
jgi:UDP-N-acetylmuramate--alanine ligase